MHNQPQVIKYQNWKVDALSTSWSRLINFYHHISIPQTASSPTHRFLASEWFCIEVNINFSIHLDNFVSLFRLHTNPFSSSDPQKIFPFSPLDILLLPIIITLCPLISGQFTCISEARNSSQSTQIWTTTMITFNPDRANIYMHIAYQKETQKTHS